MLTPTASGYAPVNGIQLFYQTFGEGKPLVLLHGGFTTGDMFAPILPAFATGRQLIVPDLQAHGRTGPLGRRMTFEALAADIAGLIRHLGHEKADVMGYSLGGNTAIRTAIEGLGLGAVVQGSRVAVQGPGRVPGPVVGAARPGLDDDRPVRSR